MNFKYSEPPSNPSPPQCCDALTKGFGRARDWAAAGQLETQQLVHACINDLRYDQQCEDSRSDWIWMLIRASDKLEECEEAVWDASLTFPDERSAVQLCELSARFAELGRERFTRRLFEIVRERSVEEDLTLGELELVRVAGMEGLLTAVAKRGQRLIESDWDWDDGYLITRAMEIMGESKTRLSLAKSRNTDVLRFAKAWRLQEESAKKSDSRPSHWERMQAIPIDDVLVSAQSDDRCYWLRGWGMHASQQDVEWILANLLKAENPEVQARLLNVFMRRELPWIPEDIFDFARSNHNELSCAAFRALKGNTNPAVRSYALESLATGRTMQGIELIASNFEPNDEQMIVEAVIVPEGADDRHSSMMACRSILETNECADADPLALIIYDHTPCSLCRTAAVNALIGQNKIPPWMVNEVRFDCDVGTRMLLYPQPVCLS